MKNKIFILLIIVIILGFLNSCISVSDRFNWDPMINEEGEIVRKGKKEKIQYDDETLLSTKLVVFYDENYTTSWVVYPQYLVSFLESKGFKTLNSHELKRWMELHINKNTAYGTSCVMSMGVVPRSLIEPRNKKCVLYKYLNAGGRIVWIGDYPLWVIGSEGGYTETFGDEIAWDILDISGGRLIDYETAVELSLTTPAKSASITDEGKKWGMTLIDNAHTFFYTINVTKVFSDVHPLYCCSWLKTYNFNYPNSGFIRYRSTLYDARNSQLNEDVYRLATYQLFKEKEK